MPSLAFGLKPVKSQPFAAKPAQKRKAVFGDETEDDGSSDTFTNLTKPTTKSAKLKLKPILDDDGDDNDNNNALARPARKSPKLSDGTTPHNSNDAARYTSLSAMRTAKLHDEQASKLDASVYDYDGVYDILHTKAKPKSTDEVQAVPKYMTSLMASAETRKRDQLRAREKLLQKERENEGDEFADKEKFVTGAYKKAQEEMRQMEEEEKRKEQEEEERRRKGGGMEAFNRGILKKEEERQQLIEQAAEEARLRKERGEDVDAQEDVSDNEDHRAADLNAQGARIAINDEGEVLDKRQLLSAGLNLAPQKPTSANQTKNAAEVDRSRQWQTSSKAQDARTSQRERQTRMVERQIEEMTRKQQEVEEAEKAQIEEKTKSKVSEDAKLSARERFLQRKKEREEEAKKKALG